MNVVEIFLLVFLFLPHVLGLCSIRDLSQYGGPCHRDIRRYHHCRGTLSYLARLQYCSCWPAEKPIKGEQR